MVNILSIDFDWIMEPSIEIYNNIANDQVYITEQLNLNPGITIQPDFHKYEELGVFLKNVTKNIKKPENIVFRRFHKEIVPAIIDYWRIDQPYNIYNIDHHHDCGYEGDTAEEVFQIGLTSANWVHFCPQLQNYTWINNKNSLTHIQPNLREHIRSFQMSSDIRLLNYVNFDYVFVCLSPGWVPNQLFPLFNVFEYFIKEGISCM